MKKWEPGVGYATGDEPVSRRLPNGDVEFRECYHSLAAHLNLPVAVVADYAERDELRSLFPAAPEPEPEGIGWQEAMSTLRQRYLS